MSDSGASTDSESSPLLDVRDLHVNFGTEEGLAEVLNGVDLRIERGQTVALVGETGCGKSVTAKAMLGLLPDNAEIPAGEIRFEGEDLLDLPTADRHERRGRSMSIIMQDPMTALNPVYTVGEQMVDVMKWQGERRVGVTAWLRDKFRDDAGLRERAIEMLERVQISAPDRVFDSYPVELSGGMRQRVLIAIAFLLEPDLLIADEPGTALDVTTEAKILRLLDDLTTQRDTGVLYITHDLGVAKKVSERISVMYAGEIVEEAATPALFDEPQHPYTNALLDSIPHLSEPMGGGLPGELPDYTDPPEACRFADRCPHAEPPCRNVFPYPRQTAAGHSVACHLYQGPSVHERHESVAAEHDVDIGDPPWSTTSRAATTDVAAGDDE